MNILKKSFLGLILTIGANAFAETSNSKLLFLCFKDPSHSQFVAEVYEHNGESFFASITSDKRDVEIFKLSGGQRTLISTFLYKAELQNPSSDNAQNSYSFVIPQVSQNPFTLHTQRNGQIIENRKFHCKRNLDTTKRPTVPSLTGSN